MHKKKSLCITVLILGSKLCLWMPRMKTLNVAICKTMRSNKLHQAHTVPFEGWIKLFL